MMFSRKYCRPELAALLCVLALPCLAAAQELEQPVGLITTSKGAKFRRSNTELALTAKAGDILFAGDAVLSEGGTAMFLYCPDKSLQTLTGSGEVVLDKKQLKVKSGQLTDRKQQPVCLLPAVEREAAASEKHL